jgi:hypothetical protein
MTNDKQPKSTYHSFAQSDLTDDRGGRFATLDKPAVTGSSPIAYPNQPPGSPWHSDPCPPEPPLGYSVEEQEPVGEVFERQPPSTGTGSGGVDGRATTATGSPVIRRKGFRRI